MAPKPQPATSPLPVRWTDQEWQSIAKQIAATKGSTRPASINVTEIKAKDVFLAQSVLPEARRRKLISIQQGFDVSRKRLREQLSTLADPVTDSAPSTAADAREAGTGSRTAPNGRSAKEIADARYKTKGTAKGPAVNEAAPRPTRLTFSASASAEEKPRNLAFQQQTKQAGETVQQLVRRPVSSKQPGRPQKRHGDVAAPPGIAVPSHGRIDSPALSETESTKLEENANLPEHEVKRGISPTLDFVELMRPFVAMVCEEVANAFVKVLGDSASTDALRAAISPTSTDIAARPQYSVRTPESFPPVRTSGRATSTPESGSGAAVPEEDLYHAETDVQPLFDPKLPPDPNSPFRPRIALVASDAEDVVDLQQRFPQFELIAVTLDDLRSTPVLRTCQRIVGLRENVPVAADEYLRRSFGSRYYRAIGGPAKVREQLQTWLNNPFVGGHDAFPRDKHASGKGSAGKKRPFRKPRP